MRAGHSRAKSHSRRQSREALRLQLRGTHHGSALVDMAGAVDLRARAPPRDYAALAFDMLVGACDSHMHVFGTTDKYTGLPEARYTTPKSDVDTPIWRRRRACTWTEWCSRK